jgi:hypothetical protein
MTTIGGQAGLAEVEAGRTVHVDLRASSTKNADVAIVVQSRAGKHRRNTSRLPVPMAFHSFNGWKASLFGDHHMHGPEGVRFYTRLKTITTRGHARPQRATSLEINNCHPTIEGPASFPKFGNEGAQPFSVAGGIWVISARRAVTGGCVGAVGCRRTDRRARGKSDAGMTIPGATEAAATNEAPRATL